MRERCPVCRVTAQRQEEKKRYIDKQFIPESWKTDQAFVYRFKCRGPRKCGEWHVATWSQGGDKTKPQKDRAASQGLWNQSQKHKPNKQKYLTTYCIWTKVVKVDTANAYEKILKRERFFQKHLKLLTSKKFVLKPKAKKAA